jgi:hypothetical protein
MTSNYAISVATLPAFPVLFDLAPNMPPRVLARCGPHP